MSQLFIVSTLSVYISIIFQKKSDRSISSFSVAKPKWKKVIPTNILYRIVAEWNIQKVKWKSKASSQRARSWKECFRQRVVSCAEIAETLGFRVWMNFLVDDKLNVTPLRIFIHQAELRVTYKLYPRPQFLTRGSRLIYARSKGRPTMKFGPTNRRTKSVISKKRKKRKKKGGKSEFSSLRKGEKSVETFQNFFGTKGNFNRSSFFENPCSLEERKNFLLFDEFFIIPKKKSIHCGREFDRRLSLRQTQESVTIVSFWWNERL